MNIKQAELQSGVSRQNIRFYEKAGLLHPARNAANDYREYGEEEIRTLKLIRMLRMLDMPLETIGQLLAGDVSLDTAARSQQQRLREQAEELQAAIRFCGELQHSGQDLVSLDVDGCLARMTAAKDSGGFFLRWKEDYRRIAQAQSRGFFSFVPDGPVTNGEEFAAALRAWAASEKADLVITKGGMYPHFTVDGVPYWADRVYELYGRAPLAVIRCHLEGEQGDESLPGWKRRLVRAVRAGLPFLVLFGLIVGPRLPGIFRAARQGGSVLELLVFPGTLAVVFGILAYRFYVTHFNDKTH